MHKLKFEINGKNISTLEDFYDEVSRVLIPGHEWGRNLDALNDILRGGFGTPDGGFILQWNNSSVSQERLGYGETARQLKMRAVSCHPSNRQHVAKELEEASSNRGPTVFDWLVEIIQNHCPGGAEEKDGIELLLS
jgi:RNAse (barnase) inhibitor barstar